jgi:hypothetical protein
MAPSRALKFGLVSEGQQESDRLWSFREGMLGHDDSIKDFQVEASGGDAGKVSWASCATGESYLVISLRHHLHEAHHVVPAAAVERISIWERKVWLRLTRSEVEQAPEHHDPEAPLESPTVDAVTGTVATWLLRG